MKIWIEHSGVFGLNNLYLFTTKPDKWFPSYGWSGAERAFLVGPNPKLVEAIPVNHIAEFELKHVATAFEEKDSDAV